MSNLQDKRTILRKLFTGILSQLDITVALDAVRPRVECFLGKNRKGAHTPMRLVAFGKAAIPMTAWFVDAWGDRIVDGAVSAPALGERSWPLLRCFAGGHPLPDEDSLRAGKAALDTAGIASEAEAMVFLISGGGSALLESPLDRAITLSDLQQVNRYLVTCGADIVEINVVRKHISAVKGGRLAAAAHPSTQLTLYVSDVPHGQDSSVASGPTMPDESTLADLRAILAKYDLERQFPSSVRALLDNPALSDTPKAGHPCFGASEWICILSNRHAVEAAERLARQERWVSVVDNSVDDDDVAEAAQYLLERLRRAREDHTNEAVCVISGGELSSPVRGRGKGGRNQAFVLECVRRIDGQNIAVLSAGTDGIDGNSPAAGAVADGTTLERARALGIDPADHVAQSDAYGFFSRLGDDITCGATENNVRDIRVLVAWP